MFRAIIVTAAVSAGAWAVGSQMNGTCPFTGEAYCLSHGECTHDINANTSALVSPVGPCCQSNSTCCSENESFVSAVADEKPKAEVKEVKLTGTLVCGSCKLNESKKCANVLQVKDKDKTISYWLTDKASDEAYHEKICGGGELKDVTVTGVVTEKDGKKMVKASKVDVK